MNEAEQKIIQLFGGIENINNIIYNEISKQHLVYINVLSESIKEYIRKILLKEIPANIFCYKKLCFDLHMQINKMFPVNISDKERQEWEEYFEKNHSRLLSSAKDVPKNKITDLLLILTLTQILEKQGK